MDLASILEATEIAVDIGGVITKAVVSAIQAGNVGALLDKPLRELIPDTLRTTLAKKAADIAAAAKFGPPT